MSTDVQFLSGLTFLNFICMHLVATPIYMYVSSAIIGIGSACIWTAQGDFVHVNSPTPHLVVRNTGIFRSMVTTCFIFGNLYVYIAWRGAEYIDSAMRSTLFIVLGISSMVGSLLFLSFKTISGISDGILRTSFKLTRFMTDDREMTECSMQGCLNSHISAVKLLFSRELLFMVPLFLYTGYQADGKNIPHKASSWGFFSACDGVHGHFAELSSWVQHGNRPRLFLRS